MRPPRRKHSVFDDSSDETDDEVSGSQEKKEDEDAADSDSSTEELRKAQFSLKDLEDFDSFEEKARANRNEEDSVAASEAPDDAHEESEFYDFSQIIRSQQELCELKSTAKEEETVKEDETVKESVPTKARKRKQSTTVKRDNDNEDISNLLAIGEKPSHTKSKRKKINDQTDPTPTQSSIEHTPQPNLPKKNVEVVIQVPAVYDRSKKKKNITELLMRKLNAIRRENQVYLHKVGLLCLLSHGFYINNLINSDDLMALCLSVVGSINLYPPPVVTMSYIERIVPWYKNKFTLICDGSPGTDLYNQLALELETKTVHSVKNFVIIFVCIARVLGLKCRFMMSLQSAPLKLRISESTSGTKSDKSNQNEASSDSSELEDEFVEVQPKKGKPVKKNMPSSRARKCSKTTTPDDYSLAIPGPSRQVKATPQKNKMPQEKKTTQGKKTTQQEMKKPEKSKQAPPSKKKESKKGSDYWVEVYIEKEGRWVSILLQRMKIDCIQLVRATCTPPVTYVLGYNNDNSVKDLSKRYLLNWVKSCKKHRVEAAWWEESLRPWLPRTTSMEKKENKELESFIEDMPLPVTISEYKGHPLFALQRHLLKYEAIYPPDVAPIGFIKGEAVYARVFVVELHSRETWLRKGKSVKLGEVPYKTVKAHAKYDKLSNQRLNPEPLGLFGQWQVVQYIPPPVVDGKLPRNEYGNIEVYQPWMVPAGAVHLQVPGLAKIAKRLNIDCAPAVVGWEHRGGGSHPVIDGFIVCEEYQDKLLDLWNKEIDESAQKSRAKVEKRVFGNWRLLIKGLLIRERLKEKYNFGTNTGDAGTSEAKSPQKN